MMIGIGVGAIILVAVLYFVLGGSGGPSSSSADIALEVSMDKDIFNTSEEINLTIHLDNVGDGETCLSNIDGGTIVFSSITRDGEEVETRSVPADYIEAFPMLLEISLGAVNPGEDVHLTLTSENDPGLGARVLSTTALEDGVGVMTFYNIEEVGNYEIELAYEYTGPASSDCSDVFRGPTNTASIAFTVTP